MAVKNIAPHGALGIGFKPSWYRPGMRLLEGGEGAGAPPVPQAAGDDSGTDWKAEARKWESRAKDNKTRADANEDAARRLADLENANKTAETQNAQRSTELENKLAAAERTALVARVQASHGLSDEDAALFLTGADEAALTAQAKRLAERVAAGPVVPGEGTPNNPSSDDPMRALARRLFNSEE